MHILVQTSPTNQTGFRGGLHSSVCGKMTLQYSVLVMGFQYLNDTIQNCTANPYANPIANPFANPYANPFAPPAAAGGLNFNSLFIAPPSSIGAGRLLLNVSSVWYPLFYQLI